MLGAPKNSSTSPHYILFGSRTRPLDGVRPDVRLHIRAPCSIYAPRITQHPAGRSCRVGVAAWAESGATAWRLRAQEPRTSRRHGSGNPPRVGGRSGHRPDPRADVDVPDVRGVGDRDV